jgi:hypothetical protein
MVLKKSYVFWGTVRAVRLKSTFFSDKHVAYIFGVEDEDYVFLRNVDGFYRATR